VSGARAPVRLVFLWHHHQPDYRSPRDGRALLPWVRLHATKDYLDMALHLERHPGVQVCFNFVPSLLDQVDDLIRGAPDALFDLLRQAPGSLSPADRAEVVARCGAAPRHALERWPAYRRLCDALARRRQSNGGDERGDEILALETWFLLAWLDPMLLGEPEARAALARPGEFTLEQRDGLLALHDRLLAAVIPAYRRLAERGQIELSASPYYHPILPLLVDVRAARRARPALPLPTEPFSAPEDAARQIERGLERHARAFGSRPSGMWPPEGSVSPEAAGIAAAAGVRWLASDEGVLWNSLPPEARKRAALYRPWRLATRAGDVAFFFRDHELSDRIGFVYHHWAPDQAVADFLGRVRRIGEECAGPEPLVVSVILDGENCWEYYADDGGPFLEALYEALEQTDDIVTRTPSQVLAESAAIAALPTLHSGSWINADFRIWIGHPEKNRAWDLLARTRRALIAQGTTPESCPAAWDSLAAAEGSDWFWWFGDDHFTPDKTVFDGLFREHLRAAFERSGLAPPGWLQAPIVARGSRREAEARPLGFVRPRVDGERTGFYEWHAAGHHRLGAGGGSMHHGAGIASDLFFGFDAECLYLRIDFTGGRPPGAAVDLVFELLAPRPGLLRVNGLTPGERRVEWAGAGRSGEPVSAARCSIGSILEIGLPFASLGLAPREAVEMLGMLQRTGETVETVPSDDVIRFSVPDETSEAAMWSA
jgi:alpha-amylase/alpha-mannosidase (GH57 family)